MKRFLPTLLLLPLLPGWLAAAEIDFVRDVRPILEKHCYECHAGDVRKSGLRLDIRSEAMKGGELYGEAILPGEPGDSPLVQFIADENADLVMPPDGERPTAAEIATLTQWVEQGANWPDGVDRVKLEDPRDHWSFQPVAASDPPPTKNTTWARSEIDRFILARLEEAGLQPSPEADRRDWLRRVTYDLIGLPPTPQEVETFLADDSDQAYQRVVDRLLASPRYGERWAQHWLDVARYADTHGFEVNTERPNAWPYRDYVIESLNEDKPYDQFVREQLAGDTMDEIPATGFLVTASVLLPGQIGKDEASKRLARQDSLDEIVTNIGTVFLGLTVNCARCHNHKFDPISQRDYYEMQAFISGVEYKDRSYEKPLTAEQEQQLLAWKQRHAEIDQLLVPFAPLAGSDTKRSMVNSFENWDRFEPIRTQQVRFTILKTNKYEPCLDELEVFNTQGENVAAAKRGGKPSSSGDNVNVNRHELRFVNDGNYGNSRSWMSNAVEGGWVSIEFAQPEEIDRVVWGRDRNGKFSDRLAIEYVIDVLSEDGTWQRVASSDDRVDFQQAKNAHAPITAAELPPTEAKQFEALRQEQASLASQISSFDGTQTVFAGVFREPDAIRVLGRGSPEMPKEAVGPAVIDILGDVELPQDADEAKRRQTLADWITQPDNPLTARVMVNRIWQGHFGMGLVETANDFGRNGTTPSHPKLLDWLSHQFVAQGWSMKALHREIVLSATYRQSTRFDPRAAEFDADDRLLWRYPLRRLSGEAIRDSILAINGELNLSMGGPGFSLFDKRGGLSGFKPIESFGDEGLRRMIYSHRVRRERDAVFGAFDCPDFGQSTPRRRESTTAIQALNMFNSRFVIEHSQKLAERVEQAMPEPSDQIDHVYELVLNRAPSEEERSDALLVAEQHGLATVCRVLLNSNEFLYIP